MKFIMNEFNLGEIQVNEYVYDLTAIRLCTHEKMEYHVFSIVCENITFKRENKPYKFIFRVFIKKYNYPDYESALNYLKTKALNDIIKRLKHSDNNGLLIDWLFIDKGFIHYID